MKHKQILTHYFDEIEGYNEYMAMAECLQETCPEKAEVFYMMACDEKSHAESFIEMYPEIEYEIIKLAMKGLEECEEYEEEEELEAS